MPAARRIARFHEVQLHVLVGSWMVGAERSEHVRGKAAIAGAGFDQRERPAGRRELGHLGDLTGEKRAEDGTDIDAGKKIARAPGSAGGAGVVAEPGLIERELHERGDRQRAAFPNDLANPSGR